MALEIFKAREMNRLLSPNGDQHLISLHVTLLDKA